MKRLFGLILALVLALSMTCFVSAEGEPTVVKVVCGDDWFPGVMEYFNSTHSDIQIEQVIYSGSWIEFMTKMSTLLAAGDAPDIAFMTFNYMEYFGNNGYIVDLSERIANDPDMANIEFMPGNLEALTLDGKVWGLPFEIRNTQMWYSKDVFDAFGVEYPDPVEPLTMDEWGELLRKFAGQTNPANGKVVEGASIRWDEWGYFTYGLFAQGMPGFIAEDGTSNWSDERVVSFIDKLNSFYQEGLIVSDDMLQTNSANTLLANDQLAFLQTGTWDWLYAGEYDNLGAMPNPGGETNIWMDPWVMFSTSKNQDAAWEVMKWLVSDDYWNWKLDNTVSTGLPTTVSGFEMSKGRAYAGADEATIQCLYNIAVSATPLQSHEAIPTFNELTKEIMDMMKLGDLSAEEACAMMDEEWNYAIEDAA